MSEEIKRTPIQIKKRKPIKLKKKEERSNVFSDLFSSMSPPQNKVSPTDMGNFVFPDLEPTQLLALQQTNFALWAATSGIDVDHKPFDFDNHKYMLPMYMDESREIVLMKSAQMGATIWMLLRLLWFCLHNVIKACLYFPTQDGVYKLSRDRLTPLIHSNLQLSEAVQDTDTMGYKKIGDKSSLYLQHMGGETTKDSTPFDFICFDEVRLLSPADIDQARERLSHSVYKYVMQVSTAGYPGCFSKGAYVIVQEISTGYSLPKKIEDVYENFHLYRALSYDPQQKQFHWSKILNAAERKRNTVKVNLWGGHTVTCTPDHKFAQLSSTSTIEWNEISGIKQYPKSFGGVTGPKEGPLCALEIPELGVPITKSPYDKFTLATIGCYISEGSIHKKEVNFWQNKNTRIRKHVKGWADIQNIPFREDEGGIHLLIKKRPDLLGLFDSCGRGEPNKKIPDNVLGGSKEQLLIVLAWIIEGDGHWRKERTNNHEGRREFDIYTSSKTLAYQLLFVGLKVGKPLSISSREPRENEYNGKVIKSNYTQYQLSYNPFSFHTQEILPQLGQIAVKSIEPSKETTVYDLHVENYPNFVLAESGCLVHNCFIGETNIPVKHIASGDRVLKSFKDLHDEEKISDYMVLSYQHIGAKKPVWRSIKNIICTGTKTVVRVTLGNSKIIICTEDHPFAVLKVNSQLGTATIEWVPAKLLQKKHVLRAVKLFDAPDEPNKAFPCLEEIFVDKVERLPTKRKVYDIEVGENTPWFFLGDSRCLVHNSDIHRAFIQGTQNFWHVNCSCSDGFIPSDCWPDCVEITKTETYLQCPKCRKKIVDAQDGRFISHNPNGKYPSYHISQFLSKFITVEEIWDAWQRTQNLKEFFNAKLGKPYVDEENQPIKDDDLEACVNPDLLWKKTPPTSGARIQRAMGVDQMSGVNYVLIAERHHNKKRVIHYEIIDDRNPEFMEAGRRITVFKRLYHLMTEFDIDLCIVDAMPNINEAMEFARAFPKRVFVAHYIEAQREMVQWEDRPRDKLKIRKGGPKIKFKYTCLLSRYLSIDFALAEIANRNYEWPTPEKLVQVCRSLESGRYEPLHIFRTHFFLHLKSIVRQKTILDEATGRFKMEWVNLGLDPHSIHATNFCNIALERLRRQPLMTFM